jgi:threonine/homoserine/homoserine lactone efflux protein
MMVAMPPFSVIATIFVVHWLLTMTPGPNAVLVAHSSSRTPP